MTKSLKHMAAENFYDSYEGFIVAQLLIFESVTPSSERRDESLKLVPFGKTEDEVNARRDQLLARVKKISGLIFAVVIGANFITLFLDGAPQRAVQMAMGITVVLVGLPSMRWCSELVNTILDPVHSTLSTAYLYREVRGLLEERVSSGAMTTREASKELDSLHALLICDRPTFADRAIAYIGAHRGFAKRAELDEAQPLLHYPLGDGIKFERGGYSTVLLKSPGRRTVTSLSTCCGKSLLFSTERGRLRCTACDGIFSESVVDIKTQASLEEFFQSYLRLDVLEAMICATSVWDR